MNPLFELRQVTRRYPRRDRRGAWLVALDAVTFDLPAGTVTGLSGPSGAGKSTLARLLLRLEKPDGGELLYRGRPLAVWPRADFCRAIQMVFQDPHLAVNPVFSAEQIVAEPLRIAGHSRSQARRLMAGVLEAVEFPVGCLGRYPAELSAGQLQRATLARALVRDPDYLVFDEPFSRLDEIAAARLLQLLARLQAQRRLGMLLICHDPRHGAALATRRLRLEGGRLAGD